MAVPIEEFKIIDVKPAFVTAVVTFNISSYEGNIRSEWDSLKEHDELYLLSIYKQYDFYYTMPETERLGIEYVRGCEIIEIRDENESPMNEFTGGIKPKEWKKPEGELRTVTIALDTEECSRDGGAEDVYGSFNILMRKPKENNSKAILESIRDLVNRDCVLPDWLHNKILGHMDSSAAQQIKMSGFLETVDFKHTFLGGDHLK